MDVYNGDEEDSGEESQVENEARQFLNDLSDDSDMNFVSTHMAHVSPISSGESEDEDD